MDPSEGYILFLIKTPTGRLIRYKPPVKLCKQAQLVHLPAGEKMPTFDGVSLFLSSEGPVFTEPGVYQIAAELTGIDGSRNVFSSTSRINIRPPDIATEKFAYELWDTPASLEALYLRHPLTDKESWDVMEDRLASIKLRPGNTTASYINYIAALGWMTPFNIPNKLEKAADLNKAIQRLKKVDTNGLPQSVEQRKKGVVENKKDLEKKTFSKYYSLMATRPLEKFRVDIPPSGLFGGVGLNKENNGDQAIDPFVRVVPSLIDSPLFADIVCWNIENLHAPNNFKKIPQIAELIRSFRCDFWGLQEVGRTALARLKETINSASSIKYDFIAVDGGGQQSGALFRTDTTSVEQLPIPEGFFDNDIELQMRDCRVVQRKVFLRLPLICNVKVRQSNNEVFDFRCAIVHLKSTDLDIKDKGDSMRLAAAAELARWLRKEREEGVEQDYIIMGDMNAETAKQGLEGFTQDQELELLSIGMQDRYNDALTRVASKRLLDHTVVTSDTITAMPEEDLEEQLIIRTDTQVANWTTDFSDHIPVAVRFILGPDRD